VFTSQSSRPQGVVFQGYWSIFQRVGFKVSNIYGLGTSVRIALGEYGLGLMAE
jgi:hypothetical protein